MMPWRPCGSWTGWWIFTCRTSSFGTRRWPRICARRRTTPKSPARRSRRCTARWAIWRWTIDGVARRGLLVRHLVLPDGLAGTREIMEFLAREVSPRTYVNVMGQYRPCGRAAEHPSLTKIPHRPGARTGPTTGPGGGPHPVGPAGETLSLAVSETALVGAHSMCAPKRADIAGPPLRTPGRIQHER